MKLKEFNRLSIAEAKVELTKCCGAETWVNKMTDKRPFTSVDDILENAEIFWGECAKEDWLEAFEHHPKIGDINSLKKKFAATKDWASNEQGGVGIASDEVIRDLSNGNKLYEEKFGFIFIVCATGKSAGQMLSLLEKRLLNKPENEIMIAAEEQGKITKIRLSKLISA